MRELVRSAAKRGIVALFGVENYPAVRRHAGNLRARLRRGLGRPPMVVAEGNELRRLRACQGQTFFGYYDVSPFSADETYVLAMHGAIEGTLQAPRTPLALGTFEVGGETPEFRPFASSRAWCWQQGCRLQWHPDDPNRLALFNDANDTGYVSRIVDVMSGASAQELQRPVYALSPDGRWAVSLDFERLQRLRPGYGYAVHGTSTPDTPAPSDDGVWLLDMHRGVSKLIVSTAGLAALEPDASMAGAIHYLNHACWNPTSERFLIFHLWLANGVRRSRMITMGRGGERPFILTHDRHVSHYCWLDAERLMAYATHADMGGAAYYLYRDLAGVQRKLGSQAPNVDGHPSPMPNGRQIVVDTYPDERREQTLYLYDIREDRRLELARFFTPYSFHGELRCDLHPRVSPSGRWVCIDSAHDGRRAMYLLELT